MKILSAVGVLFVVILMALYEWPKMDKNQVKEKCAFALLALTGWVLSVLLIYFPDMPGPTQLIEFIFKPLGKFLEH
ncbi:hypothetical protein [Calidifontibacillus erzurumensis]|uniref:Uncharacterized protein n=1 Tax=Calidifontibacillus erzurumensis TaxID=2741433 RepID=A0A8J8KCC9_9BACI|nr:hypothetical protein [Calidifontibacillus erzurumensis]NSL52492.1 hypothetical protein [Calidifontibacillus erzurumensis]